MTRTEQKNNRRKQLGTEEATFFIMFSHPSTICSDKFAPMTGYLLRQRAGDDL
jgi:hypothetical protein